MALSFKAIADEIDIFDADVDAINEARKEFWAEIREQLPARDVKALKAAIKARRKRRADLDGEEAFDARVFEILAEIERGTDVALTRGARETDPPWEEPAEHPQPDREEWVSGIGLINLKTGEVIESFDEEPAVQAEGEAAPVSGDAGENATTSGSPPRDASPTIPPIVVSAPAKTTIAPVELSPLPDIAPGAPFGLDRRPKVAA